MDEPAVPEAYAPFFAVELGRPPDPASRPAWRRALRRAGAWARVARDLVYPPHCLCCGAPLPVAGNGALCLNCARRGRWIGADRCRACGQPSRRGAGAIARCLECEQHPLRGLSGVCAVAAYDGPLGDLILSLKAGGGLPAVPLLGRLLAQRVRETLSADGLRGVPRVVPVPLARDALRGRGFNQSAWVARIAARELGWPIELRRLRKIRATRPQAGLGGEARRTNLADAFAASPPPKDADLDAGILLVDDVLTTGSTLRECARALRAAGWPAVRGAVIARAC